MSISKKFDYTVQLLGKLGLGHLSLNQKISSLSGGENQRIRLSQALKKGKTKIFGLDEPSMGLGRKEMIDLISVIYENIENYGKTFIVIEHNTEFLNLYQYVNELVRDNRKVKVIPGNAGLTQS
jgi:putative uvrABC system protein A